MPILVVTHSRINPKNQSIVYHALFYSLSDLAGVNALEEAEVQMIWEATQDVFNAFAKTAFAPKNKQVQ